MRARAHAREESGRDQAQALTADTWTADSAAALDRLAGQIEQAIRVRTMFLQV